MTNYFAHIGRTITTHTITVELSLIKRLAKALLQPEHSETLTLPAIMSLGDYESVFETITLPAKAVLQSKHSVQVYQDIQAGDKLEVTTLVKDMYEQQADNNPLGFLIIEVIGKKGKKVAFRNERIFAIRGGYPRS